MSLTPKIIVVHGLPAVGKLTVAKELAELTGFKLFHNHIVVDLLLSVFDFGSPSFVKLREEMWLSVMNEAVRTRSVRGLIFTFAPENTVTPGYFDKLIASTEALGGEILFVKLICKQEDIEARMNSDSRQDHKKLKSVELFRQLQVSNTFECGGLPEVSGITLDTSALTPVESALAIKEHFHLCDSES